MLSIVCCKKTFQYEINIIKIQKKVFLLVFSTISLQEVANVNHTQKIPNFSEFHLASNLGNFMLLINSTKSLMEISELLS